MITSWVCILFLATLVAWTGGAQNLRSLSGLQRFDGPVTLSSSSLRSREEIMRTGRRCGTKEPSEESMYAAARKLEGVAAQSDSAKASRTNIDTYFHVIQADGNEDVLVADADIERQLAVLNSGFAEAGFRFVLNGITRTEYIASKTIAEGSLEEHDMKAGLRTGGADTLNVYIIYGDGALGRATYPFDHAEAPILDGVVIDPRTMPGGTMEPYNEGITLVHQVGHWMGLFHPFQGGCNPFSAEGDAIYDTPAAAHPHYGCPQQTEDSCPGYEMQLRGNDLLHNYMDYGDDACLSGFTAGQVVRMQQSWKAFRAIS